MTALREKARALLLQVAQGDHAARVPLADLCEEHVDDAIRAMCVTLYLDHVPKTTTNRRWVEFAHERGSRFAKITRNHMYRGGLGPGIRTVYEGVYTHCYVELQTSLIWKAATYRKPALNFARGSVFLLPERLGEDVDTGGMLSDDELERAAVEIKGDEWYRAKGKPMPWKPVK